MNFNPISKPNIFTVIAPEMIPVPRFSLFSKLEIDGVASQIIGCAYYREATAEQLDLAPGWVYHLDDGSGLVSVLAEQELFSYLPTNELEFIAIAS